MRGTTSPSRVLAFRRKDRLSRLGSLLLRAVFRLVGRFAPHVAAERAERLFLTPPRCGRTPFERRVLGRGALERLDSPFGPLATWRWGAGPAVLLLHGWGGHAGRLARFVDPLVAQGFSVVALDAPGHGDSPGAPCSLPDVAAAIHLLARRTTPFAVVGHSLGATAAALAARNGARFARAVFLAPAATPESYPTRFGRSLGMLQPGCELMKRRLAERYRLRWDDLTVDGFAPSMTARLLVYHDPRDRKVPFREGRAIARAWPGALLVPVRGVGHHSILRSSDVIQGAVAFLATGAHALPSAPAWAS